MDAKTATTLEESIAHWKRNVLAEHPQNASSSSRHCALCAIFNQSPNINDDDCIGCPIVERTGSRYCERTPHEAAANALEAWQQAEDDWHRDVFHFAARAELAFLESLREPAEAKP